MNSINTEQLWKKDGRTMITVFCGLCNQPVEMELRRYKFAKNKLQNNFYHMECKKKLGFRHIFSTPTDKEDNE